MKATAYAQVEKLTRELNLDNDALNKVSSLLLHEFNLGLGRETNKDATVKMFPTFVRDVPNGKEHGKFLALDLGGTNFRVLLIDIEGDLFHMESEIYAIPQQIMLGSGAQLFDRIAECLANFMEKTNTKHLRLPLGFTFSFPCTQEGLTVAKLVQWTKGFNCEGVVGRDVVELLREAIKRRADIDIDVMAVVNDTTGTLMSCAHKNRECRVGVIVGTGTNACYMEGMENVPLFDPKKEIDKELECEPEQVIINSEWGAFGDSGCLEFLRTSWDRMVDNISLNTGKQLFEKMISGMYMGELVRCVLIDLVKSNLLFDGQSSKKLDTAFQFQTAYVSWIESDTKNSYVQTNRVLTNLDLIDNASLEDKEIIKLVCGRVSTRAAYLVSAGITCILKKMKRPYTTVGVDGSVYRYHPHFHDLMEKKIAELLCGTDYKFSLMLSEDGSGRGAALVAAVAVRHNLKKLAIIERRKKEGSPINFPKEEISPSIIDELKGELNSDKEKRKEAVKKVIASMTAGKDVSSLFEDVLSSMQTDNLELKKLVYLYLINYAKSQPDMEISTEISDTLAKDFENPNPLIKALAVQTMGCIRVDDEIIEYFCEPLRKCLRDEDPDVKKTAVVCVAKLYRRNANLVKEQGFLNLLRKSLDDSEIMVVANTVAALSEINKTSSTGQPLVEIDESTVNKLLIGLNGCNTSDQLFILDTLANCKQIKNDEAPENIPLAQQVKPASHNLVIGEDEVDALSPDVKRIHYKEIFDSLINENDRNVDHSSKELINFMHAENIVTDFLSGGEFEIYLDDINFCLPFCKYKVGQLTYNEADVSFCIKLFFIKFLKYVMNEGFKINNFRIRSEYNREKNKFKLDHLIYLDDKPSIILEIKKKVSVDLESNVYQIFCYLLILAREKSINHKLYGIITDFEFSLFVSYNPETNHFVCSDPIQFNLPVKDFDVNNIQDEATPTLHILKKILREIVEQNK